MTVVEAVAAHLAFAVLFAMLTFALAVLSLAFAVVFVLMVVWVVAVKLDFASVLSLAFVPASLPAFPVFVLTIL